MLETNSASPRCRHCPAAPGSPCAGASIARLCELVDASHPDFNPAYLRLLDGDAASPSIVDPPSPPRRRGLAETLALLRAMKGCSRRIERTDCGCGGLATCTLGKGRAGIVHSGDCFDCLDASPTSDLPPRNPGEGYSP
jgi:hypothetical protein